MSLGLREDRRRRRQRARWAARRWLIAFAAIGAAGAYAYQTGSRLAARNVAALEQQVGRLDSTIAELGTRAAAQAAEIAAERSRVEDWRQRYAQDVPTGEAKALFEALQAKMAQGVTADRLRFVIERTENPRDCDQSPQVRRIAVQTPIAGGTRSGTAAFAGGSVAVVLAGVSARNTGGSPEAWFDPTQPVSARFSWPEGKTTEAAGPLPLRPSMVHGDREYRFSITAGRRGFAHVALQRCRFP
jgi:hypothetical protein